MPRLQYIDRMKGAAILFVVMGHYVIYSLAQKDIILELIGSFHMPFFMFLSGLVIYEIPNMRKNIRKVIALLMPFLTVSFLYVLFIGESYFHLLQSAFKFGYWYLYVLAVFYMFLQILRIVKFGGVKLQLQLSFTSC